MSKLKAYLELATDKSAKTVAKELKDKDDNIEALIEQLRLMILGKLKRSCIATIKILVGKMYMIYNN